MIRFLKKISKSFILKYKFSDSYIDYSASVSLDSSLSKGVKILKNVNLGNCKVEKFTYVGINSNFSNTSIGSFCSIGPEVICGLGTHPTNFASTYPGFYSQKASGSVWFGHNHDFEEQSKTIIESDVWIGARAIIIGGVKINTGAIIAAGAIVTKDVPSYAIVAGVPAKIIKYRFSPDVIKALLDSKWWELEDDLLKKVAIHIDSPELFLEKIINLKNEGFPS